MTLATFLIFTLAVAFLTWWFTRGKGTSTEDGFFLAGRSLTGVVIAGSLLLTNLSTEQLVGLNGGAFKDGLSVMAWEVIAGMSLVVMALVFLPRYLKSGITTIPQFLEQRYDSKTRALTTGVFIVAYMLILLPFVLYSGASALAYMLNLETFVLDSKLWTICTIITFIVLVGSAYAIFGGLRAVAVSDMFNGIGLLVGGILMTWFSLKFAAGEGESVFSVFQKIEAHNPDAFNSLGKKDEDVHWPTLFTGVLLLNFFYWCSNEQIIQRTFGAKNLAEGQKGVLLAAGFKILAPLILVLPGIVAFYVASQNPEFSEKLMITKGTGPDAKVVADDSKVYGSLVRLVLPPALTGFFAAVIVGSILSTFNSVLNSSATLFSLGVYKTALKPDASTSQVVKSGRWCSVVVALLAAVAAPVIFYQRENLFGFFQTLNGVYFIPLLAAILVGMFTKNSSGNAAFISILIGIAIMIWGTFFDGNKSAPNGDELVAGWVKDIFGSGYHFMGVVFVGLVILQLALGTFMKRSEPYVQQDAKAVDLTPWKPAKLVGGIMIVVVLVLYLVLAK